MKNMILITLFFICGSCASNSAISEFEGFSKNNHTIYKLNQFNTTINEFDFIIKAGKNLGLLEIYSTRLQKRCVVNNRRLDVSTYDPTLDEWPKLLIVVSSFDDLKLRSSINLMNFCRTSRIKTGVFVEAKTIKLPNTWPVIQLKEFQDLKNKP